MARDLVFQAVYLQSSKISNVSCLSGEVACLFYWWEPDPTFLLMQPTEIVFPQHEKQEWVEAIQTSSVAQVGAGCWAGSAK